MNARTAFARAMLAVGASAAVCAVAAWTYDHRDALWSAIFTALSAGGRFWFAVTVAALLTAITAAILAVMVSAAAAEAPNECRLAGAAALAAALYIAAYAAVQGSFDSFEVLSTYGKVAVIVLSPLLLPAAVIAFAGGAVVADTAVATVLGIPPSSQKPTPQE